MTLNAFESQILNLELHLSNVNIKFAEIYWNETPKDDTIQRKLRAPDSAVWEPGPPHPRSKTEDIFAEHTYSLICPMSKKDNPIIKNYTT